MDKKEKRKAIDKAYNEKRKQYKVSYSPEDIETANILDKAIEDSGLSVNSFLKELINNYLIEKNYIPKGRL